MDERALQGIGTELFASFGRASTSRLHPGALEKPDPRLFQRARERAGFAAEGALHAGNDPLRDLAGASWSFRGHW